MHIKRDLKLDTTVFLIVLLNHRPSILFLVYPSCK
jgi:hypothetical protein